MFFNITNDQKKETKSRSHIYDFDHFLYSQEDNVIDEPMRFDQKYMKKMKNIKFYRNAKKSEKN